MKPKIKEVNFLPKFKGGYNPQGRMCGQSQAASGSVSLDPDVRGSWTWKMEILGVAVDYTSVTQSATHWFHPVCSDSSKDPIDGWTMHVTDLTVKCPLPSVALPWETVPVWTGSLARTARDQGQGDHQTASSTVPQEGQQAKWWDAQGWRGRMNRKRPGGRTRTPTASGDTGKDSQDRRWQEGTLLLFLPLLYLFPQWRPPIPSESALEVCRWWFW